MPTTEGNKNEGTKIELAKPVDQPVQILQVNQLLPEFNLNAEVVSLKSVLPACGGDSGGTGPAPSGYTFTGTVTYDSFGYNVYYEKSCVETISCGICPPPGFFTYESTDTYVKRVNMVP